MQGVDVYKQLLDHDNVDKLLNKLIKNNTNSKIIACSYSFVKNYNYEDFAILIKNGIFLSMIWHLKAKYFNESALTY